MKLQKGVCIDKEYTVGHNYIAHFCKRGNTLYRIMEETLACVSGAVLNTVQVYRP